MANTAFEELDKFYNEYKNHLEKFKSIGDLEAKESARLAGLKVIELGKQIHSETLNTIEKILPQRASSIKERDERERLNVDLDAYNTFGFFKDIEEVRATAQKDQNEIATAQLQITPRERKLNILKKVVSAIEKPIEFIAEKVVEPVASTALKPVEFILNQGLASTLEAARTPIQEGLQESGKFLEKQIVPAISKGIGEVAENVIRPVLEPIAEGAEFILNKGLAPILEAGRKETQKGLHKVGDILESAVTEIHKGLDETIGAVHDVILPGIPDFRKNLPEPSLEEPEPILERRGIPIPRALEVTPVKKGEQVETSRPIAGRSFQREDGEQFFVRF